MNPAVRAEPGKHDGSRKRSHLPIITVTKTRTMLSQARPAVFTMSGMMQTMHKQNKRRRGFTLVEIMIAVVIFTLMILACAAAFPVALRAGHAGNNYAQAALIAQHKIDQCREQGYSSIYRGAGVAVTKLGDLNIVDDNSGQANPAGYPAGSEAYTFTAADNLAASNFPAGTKGTLIIGPPNTGGASHWTPVGQIVQVTVVIAWPAGAQTAGAFTTHTLIVNG